MISNSSESKQKLDYQNKEGVDKWDLTEEMMLVKLIQESEAEQWNKTSVKKYDCSEKLSPKSKKKLVSNRSSKLIFLLDHIQILQR